MQSQLDFLSFTVLNGYSCVPIALTEGLDIRLSTAVTRIKYDEKGVEVWAENLKTNNSQVVYKGEEFCSSSSVNVVKLLHCVKCVVY